MFLMKKSLYLGVVLLLVVAIFLFGYTDGLTGRVVVDEDSRFQQLLDCVGDNDNDPGIWLTCRQQSTISLEEYEEMVGVPVAEGEVLGDEGEGEEAIEPAPAGMGRLLPGMVPSPGGGGQQAVFECGNDVCEEDLGESIDNCPGDCGGDVAPQGESPIGGDGMRNMRMAGAPGGNEEGFECGNNVCERSRGENSANCPGDCRRQAAGGFGGLPASPGQRVLDRIQ